MRISYTDEEDFPGQFELWQSNCKRSLSSKAGQTALRELRAALLALPSKELVAGEFDDGENVCAVGALARHKGVVPKADPECEMEEVGMECGMPRLVAWKTVEVNDTYDWTYIDGKRVDHSSKQRYEFMLNWIEKNLLHP